MTRKHGLINIILGLSSTGGSLVTYWASASAVVVFTNQILRALSLLSYLTIGVLLLGLTAVLVGIRQVLVASALGFREGDWPSLASLVGKMLGSRRYSLTLFLSGVTYGLLYAAVSSMLIYRPDMNFAAEYSAAIPSIVPTVCCDLPGFIPILTAYLTNHLGLILVPANVILMMAVSTLVGFNIALSRFACDNKPAGIKRYLFGGFGAVAGLFTACPTCAGLFLGSVIQAAGAEVMAVALATYQPVFIGLAFPILIGSNYAIAKSIRQSLYGSCRVGPVRSV